jgi:hypothetical protein
LRILTLITLLLVGAMMLSRSSAAQDMPKTEGETLSGKHIVLATEVRGHPAMLVAGFSREGGNATGAWVRAIRADGALAGIPVYEIAQIAGAPGLIRGMIRSGMKKSVPAAEHDTFVVLTQDDKAWRTYFDVGDDQVPYVMLLDESGKVLWRGHGPAAELEPKLKAALH